jgi:hypothetical protein
MTIFNLPHPGSISTSILFLMGLESGLPFKTVIEKIQPNNLLENQQYRFSE